MILFKCNLEQNILKIKSNIKLFYDTVTQNEMKQIGKVIFSHSKIKNHYFKLELLFNFSFRIPNALLYSEFEMR